MGGGQGCEACQIGIGGAPAGVKAPEVGGVPEEGLGGGSSGAGHTAQGAITLPTPKLNGLRIQSLWEVLAVVTEVDSCGGGSGLAGEERGTRGSGQSSLFA